MDMLTERIRVAQVSSMHKELATLVLGVWPLIIFAMQNPPADRDMDFYELGPSAIGSGLHHAFSEGGFKSMAENQMTEETSLPDVYNTPCGIRHILSAVMRLRLGGILWATAEPTWAKARDMGKTATDPVGNWFGLTQYWDVIIITAVVAVTRGVHYCIELRKESSALRVEPLHSFLTSFHTWTPVLYTLGSFGHAASIPTRLFTTWDVGSYLCRSRSDADNVQGTEARRAGYKGTFAEHPKALCNALVHAYKQTRVPTVSIQHILGMAVDVDACQWRCANIIEGFYHDMPDIQPTVDSLRASVANADEHSSVLGVALVAVPDVMDVDDDMAVLSMDIPAGQPVRPVIEEYSEQQYVSDCISAHMDFVTSCVVVSSDSD